MVFERGNGYYLGSWHLGKYHGLGKYQTIDGSQYQGGWLNGLMHGHGKFSWPPTETKLGKRSVFSYIGEF